MFSLYRLKQHRERGPVPQTQATKNKQQGQAMVEYMAIVLLIALSIVFAYRRLGNTVRDQSAQISAQVAGGQVQGPGADSVGPGSRHCCGVRANPPRPTDNKASPR